MQKNLSKKAVAYRIIVGLVCIELAIFYDFEYYFFKPILLVIASYYFTCAIFKISPVYKLLKINTYNDRKHIMQKLIA